MSEHKEKEKKLFDGKEEALAITEMHPRDERA
jgi:hypothetical protein